MTKTTLGLVVLLSGLSMLGAQGLQGNVTVRGNATIAATGHSVSLTWESCPGANTYNLYRSTIHGGPYTRIATGITGTIFTDSKVSQNQTFYYVATAVSGGQESGYSNEAVVVIP